MAENSLSPTKRTSKRIQQNQIESARSPTKRLLDRGDQNEDSCKLRKKNDTTSTPSRTRNEKPKDSSTPVGSSKKQSGVDMDLDSFIAEMSAEMSGRSWAEVVEIEQSYSELDSEIGSPADTERRNRKQVDPKKRQTTKPKFLASKESDHSVNDDSRPCSNASNHSSRRHRPQHKKVMNDESPRPEPRRSPRKIAIAKRQLERANGDKGDDKKRRLFPKKDEQYGEERARHRTNSHRSYDTRSRTNLPINADLRDCLSNKKAKRDSTMERKQKEGSKGKENWEEPKAGWCTDEVTLKRRSKEIEKAKQKPVYQQYASEIARKDRVKNVHPSTPNRELNWTRRSWDAQLRQWKRKLYIFAGEDGSQASTSLNTSFADSTDGETESVADDAEHFPLLTTVDAAQLAAGNTTDGLDQVLGCFDIDSRRGFEPSNHATMSATDDNTLTGKTATTNGPSDFSDLNTATA